MATCKKLSALRDWDLLWRELARIHMFPWLSWVDVFPGGGRYFDRFRAVSSFKKYPPASALDPASFIHGCGFVEMPKFPNLFGIVDEFDSPVVVVRGKLASLNSVGDFGFEVNHSTRSKSLPFWKGRDMPLKGFKRALPIPVPPQMLEIRGHSKYVRVDRHQSKAIGLIVSDGCNSIHLISPSESNGSDPAARVVYRSPACTRLRSMIIPVGCFSYAVVNVLLF